MTLKEFLTQIAKYDLKFALASSDPVYDYTYANGCGAKGGIKFPKTMYLLNIEACCQIHDIDWTNARSVDELVRGTNIMSANLKKIIDAKSNWFMKRLRRWRASKYITEIELIGEPAEARNRGFI